MTAYESVHPPECGDCGAPMQRLNNGDWRCPWTNDRRMTLFVETPDGIAHVCDWPYAAPRPMGGYIGGVYV